jgi:MFS family permease
MGNPGDYETLFSLLYTVYSIPNIFLPFFGGYFIDKLGARKCLFVFAASLTAGQTVFAFGVSIKSWPVMLLGRVIYGFGGESISVGNSAVLADWFEGKELAFAFGINLSMARIGSVINNLVSPALASSGGVPFAFWFGSIVCAASLFCVVLVMPIDKKMEDLILANKENDRNEQRKLENKKGSERDSFSKRSESTAEKVSLKDALTFKKPFWVLVVSCLVVYGKQKFYSKFTMTYIDNHIYIHIYISVIL